jgi:hypothetical protein
MRKLSRLFWQLFEADYDFIGGRLNPQAFVNQSCANSFKFAVVEDPFWTALDLNSVTGTE